jgi:CheY-like chemotaxis protein
LAEVLRTAVEISKPLIDRGRHVLNMVLPEQPLWVDGDAVRLAQVFANLLNNAAKYTDDGGRIELTAQAVGNTAQVRVSDNGIGISADQLPRLFEMFAQLDRGKSRAQGGLGIGLSLVQRLVQMHGGSVQGASDGPGLGSQFTVRLPLAHDTTSVAEPSAPKGGLNARRLLVVDDNRDGADSLGMLLRFLGAEVHVEHDGPGALAVAASWRPSVVLLDLGMPGMDGFEVARQLRADQSLDGLRLIALTGWGQEADRERTSAGGFDHHLIKPVDINVLQTLLESLHLDPPQRVAPS